MTRTVLLLHETPDGSSHLDWLIASDVSARGDADTRDVLTLRLPREAGTPGTRHFRATRLPDHRRLYLTHEGEVPGGRGTVTRLAEGQARIVSSGPDEIVIEVRWELPASAASGGRRAEYRLVGRRENELWSFDRSDEQYGLQ